MTVAVAPALRIAMFSESYLPRISGVVHSLTAFASALRADGHRVFVVAPRVPAEDLHRLRPEQVARRVQAVHADVVQGAPLARAQAKDARFDVAGQDRVEQPWLPELS